MAAADRSPAEMIGHEHRLEASCERFQPDKVLVAHAVRGAERQADAVQAQRINLADALEEMQRLPAAPEEIFAVNFQPADVGASFEDLTVMRRAQTDAGAGRELLKLLRGGDFHLCGSP